MRSRNMKLILGAVITAATLVFSATQAAADTPLPTPTNLAALHVSDTAADLDWLSSGLSNGDTVQRNVNGNWQTYATGAFGFMALTNLNPGTSYTFRVIAVATPGLGNTNSQPSQPLTFTTLSAPDSVPPAKPATPTFTTFTTTWVSVFWPETTDNVQVTGYYLQQLINGTWTTIRTIGPGDPRLQGVYGLTANTAYTFGVIAFDARGNLSPRSNPGTVTTLANTPNPTCKVQLITYNPGFQFTVTITNTTTATLDGWTVRFTLPPAASIWTFNGVLTRDGSTATFTPAVYNKTIGPGGQTYPGGSGSASPFTPPSGFTLNGLPCDAA
jgi:FlaG/FlaF family flagellin (archaellin)